MASLSTIVGILTASSSTLGANILDGINIVGQSVPGAGGSLGEILVTLAGNIRPIFAVAALIMISIAGFRMVIGQEDEASTKAKTTINLCVAGLVLSYLTSPFIASFFGNAGEVVLTNASAGAAALSGTMLMVINIFAVLASSLGALTLIFVSIRAIVTGTEEGITLMRTAIFAVVGGIVLLLVAEIVANVFATAGAPGSPSPLIAKGAQIIKYVLGYTALLGVAVVIFGGLQLITSQGDEGQKDKAKNLIIRVIIGIGIILLAMATVQTIANLFGATIG